MGGNSIVLAVELLTTKNVMRSLKRFGVRGVLIGIPALFVLCGIFMPIDDARAQDPEAIIIGNKNIPEAPLSKMDIQNIFLGKKTKFENTKVTFVILESGDVHEYFLKEYLSRTPAQYRKYWKKIVFTGKGKAPKAVKTEEDMIKYVEDTEGAIGYIGPSTAQDIQSQNIHQLTIQ